MVLIAVPVTARLGVMALPVHPATSRDWVIPTSTWTRFARRCCEGHPRVRLPARRRRPEQRPSLLPRPTARAPTGARCSRKPIGKLAHGPGVVVFEGAFSPMSWARAEPATRFCDHRHPTRGRPGPRQVITSASPAPTTGSGTPRRSSRCTRPTSSPSTYANDTLAVVCEARRAGDEDASAGRDNVVNPGGKNSVRTRRSPPRIRPRRAPGGLSRYPHRTSPASALEGAVAHCDMPTESGPTRVPPPLAAVCRRVHRVQPARVRRLPRRAPRAGAAARR